jgi:hypothetical protein
VVVFTRYWVIGLSFAAMVLVLPIGLRYSIPQEPNIEQIPYWIRIEFVFPVFIEFLEGGNIDVSYPVSSLGILLPVISTAHIILAAFGVKIAKREVDFSMIWKLVAIVAFIDLAAFIPTFRMNWGSFPLPLIILIGLPLAWLGRLPPTADPFADTVTE